MTELDARQLASAARVLKRNPRSSMGDIARELEISRATLNRAVISRAALVEAMAHFVLDEQSAAHRELGVDRWFTAQSRDLTAVAQLVESLLRSGPQIAFLVTSPEAAQLAEVVYRADALDEQLDEAFERAQRVGAIRAVGLREWPRASLYALTFAAGDLVLSGALAPRDASRYVMDLWLSGLAPQ